MCDWLASVSLPDGGLPFALPYAQAAGTARWWAGADPRTSSLHITAAVTAAAHRAARHDPALARHSWLADATRFCLEAIAAREQPRSTMELLFSLRLLDAVVDDEPTAGPLLDRWAAAIPPSGLLQVQGGAEDEAIRPLDFSPEPDRPLRRHLAPEVVAADLDRLAGGQRDDGGWDIDHVAYSPASELEWRGYMTVHALGILAANGRALR